MTCNSYTLCCTVATAAIFQTAGICQIWYLKVHPRALSRLHNIWFQDNAICSIYQQHKQQYHTVCTEQNNPTCVTIRKAQLINPF